MERISKNAGNASETVSIRAKGRITKFIVTHFKKDYYSHMSSGENNRGEIIHLVDVNQDDTIYHLQFNNRGELMQVGAEPIMMHGETVGERLYSA